MVFRWYTQLDRRRFVYDTYKTMKATRTRHGWVHMFTTHWPTNFITSICSGLVLHCNWQDFNWHDASRGPSAIAELLVPFWYRLTRVVVPGKGPLNGYVCMCLSYRFRDSAGYCRKSPILTHPTCIQCPVRVTPVEFRRYLWRQKTRVPGLSCGFVCHKSELY